MNKLEIKDLHVSREGKEILKGLNIEIQPGKVYALMGPNGAGKSTLSNVIMGHPKYQITKGKIILDGTDITNLPTNERAKKGLFLSFQYPTEIPGVTLGNFLRTAYNNLKGTKIGVLEFYQKIKEEMKKLDIDLSFTKRYLNEGFSGGEKKRAEILQLILFQPKYAILDECDSGLDINAIKTVGENIQKLKDEKRAILLITHYYRILNYITPDVVFIIKEGKIVKTGDADLAKEIEERGFNHYLNEVQL